ncbi:TetR/AcrR family transcriptional regulator [Streptomyces sp. M2CJ-2]|uniref:TetR/AcrR family transcriptional regulator n=1 Tax=Streptomyces sp. M2CJ-2 TaxID=2803948 RepID=UPI0019287A25|nr:TetR/AcrR family transcriptional regulator [Streptomyces sp. M2CJ-2]MBL3668275.1 TetR/AcrR family transcriptional regulator [Streptomyces sp. M2CJ-2]
MAAHTTSRRSQQERTKATTDALLSTARELFAEQGFAATSLGAICERAGVTRGAFYHHFSNKEQIFREVYTAEQKGLAAVVRRAFQAERDPWDGMFAGCEALLEASLEPTVRRITLVEAPGALDWVALRDIQAGCKEQMHSGLAVAVEAGCIPARPLAPLTSLLYGAICESALDIARAEDQRAALRDTLTQLDLLLAGAAGRTTSGCAHKD